MLSHTASAAQVSRVAIVIDDIGYRYSDANALNLPGNITFSILPHTPYGKKLAEQANIAHHDVLLHIPMEAENGKRLGPGALTTKMTKKNIHDNLSRAFAEIPFAVGINNHMGSRLTQLYQPMIWMMSFLKSHQLFFLDSKTSAHSQAEKAALAVGVPIRNRHVFLDNQLDEEYIEQQFNQLINQAQKHKLAIAIAHPHPETVKVLSRLIPSLADNNIDLVPLSELYNNQRVASINTVSTDD